MIKVFLYLSLINLFCFNALGFVIGKTNSGLNLKWNMPVNGLKVHVDSTSNFNNSLNLDQDEINSIILSSINEWSGKTQIKLISDFNSTIPPIGTSATIRFSNNTSFFGQGVLALTSIEHDPSNGEILSADILINESINNSLLFTDDPALSSGSSFAFLGDIVTHELGHLLGLSHSEVIGSSMLYSVFKGQFDLADDDIAGVNYLYTTGSSKKVFRGKVTSGNGEGVFGANVQVILTSNGEVFSGFMTDEYGYFYLKDVPENENFLIYVSPPRSITNLPSYFASSQTSLCHGQKYKASFFTQCGGRNKSRPQLFSSAYEYEQLFIDINDYYNKEIKFDWNDRIFDFNYYNYRKNMEYYYSYYDVYDLGEITIRCEEQIDPNYFTTKFTSSNSFDVFKFNALKFEDFLIAGDTFLGKFTQSEVDAGIVGKGDLLHLDYTTFDEPSGHFLDLKISTETIGSMLKLVVKVKNLVTNNVETFTTDTDPQTGRNLLNFHIKHPLSVDPSENDFEISIVPENETIFGDFEQQEILAVPDKLKNPDNTYLFMFTLGLNGDNGYETYPIKQFRFPKDNWSCREGVNTAKVRANVTDEVNFERDESSSEISCATVDLNNNSSGGGPFSFMLGFLGIMFLCILQEYRLKVLSK